MQPSSFTLGQFPTPLHPLPRLARLYPGYDLWIKRDDLSGLAMGGNKVRKLEYLLAEALHIGCDTLLTAGALQSNHCRQTAAAAARAGLACHLLIGGQPPGRLSGNLLLCHLLGAQLHFAGADRTGAGLPVLQHRLDAEGHRCYPIPYGGSNLTGAMGFVEAVREWAQQEKDQQIQADYLFFASSSGGTQAGLMVGKAHLGLKAQLMPVRIDKEHLDGEPLVQRVSDLANTLAENMSLQRRWTPTEVPLLTTYDTAGYAQTTAAEWDDIHLLARTEGILLDPVYSGRAFHAMLDHLRKGMLPTGSTVLFWHTGGTPALFADTPA
jgi:D-cysteine desulfhydrase family pyridoxal phosphate-dependent enzyme